MRASSEGRWFGLQSHILLAAGFAFGTSAGTLVEFLAPDAVVTTWLLNWFIRPVEQMFLTVLFLLIVPLLFSTIVTGIARLRGNAGLQGMLVTTLAYMAAVSAAAALIGLAMANLFRPGDGIPPEIGQHLLDAHNLAISRSLLAIAPSYRMLNGSLLAMAVVSLAVGIALPLFRLRDRRWLLDACEKLFQRGMNVLSLVTRFAPIAVACFMFDMTVMFGWHLLFYLTAYVMVVVAALALQIVVTFFVVVWMRGEMSPPVFLRGVQEAALIAFSTSSSNATLPTALKAAEDQLGLPGRIARPILGIGTVANQGGTTIYTAVTIVFVGQFFGINLSLSQQAIVFAVATLAGMGTIGVPAGALPTVTTVLALTGLPPEGIGLVIGVDRLLDMFRTLVNVIGDLAIAVAISRDLAVAKGNPASPNHEIS